jgi:hypothetical protein
MLISPCSLLKVSCNCPVFQVVPALVVPMAGLLPWQLVPITSKNSASVQTIFSSLATFSPDLSPLPSKLCRQSCCITCLLINVSGWDDGKPMRVWFGPSLLPYSRCSGLKTVRGFQSLIDQLDLYHGMKYPACSWMFILTDLYCKRQEICLQPKYTGYLHTSFLQ